VINKVVDEAVKVVVLEKEPEIAYWKKSAELWEKEAKSGKIKASFKWGCIGVFIGFIAGIIIINRIP